MASQTKTGTKATGQPRPGRRPERPRRYRAWWAWGAAAGLVAAGAIVWTAAGDDGGNSAADGPVEQFQHAHGLAVPTWAPEGVFLSTHHGLIYIGADGWSYVGGQRHDFMGFAAHPTQRGVVYTSGHPADGSGIADPVGFMVSTDGGTSWQVRALEGEADFHTMTVGAGGAVIYGWNVTGQVGLYRSTDEGNTWQLVNTPSLAATGVFALAAHPTDPDQLWAATATGLMHSSDAAASWQQATNRAPVTTVTVDPSAPDRLLAYAAQPGDGLLESSDGGQTWTPIGWRLAAAGDAVIHLAVDPDDPQQLYAATAGQDLLHSRDGGSSWQHLARAGVPTT